MHKFQLGDVLQDTRLARLGLSITDGDIQYCLTSATTTGYVFDRWVPEEHLVKYEEE